jgi:lipoate-protein ligase A
MKLLINYPHITDPKINLAIEEYIVRNLNLSHDYVFLYINQPSIIIGKHQNAWEEINLKFIESKNIPVIRRISGGGAVYHDLGNLNFSFIRKYDKKLFNQYMEFIKPIIKTLESLGVKTKLNKKNNLLISYYKISGNAQFTSKDRILSHGTLLYNSNLKNMKISLKAQSHMFESKAVKSIRSSVTNISKFITNKIDILKFKQTLLRHIFDESSKIPIYTFSNKEWIDIKNLVNKKYSQWEWNYGESPRFIYNKTVKFNQTEVKIKIVVCNGLIELLQFDDKFSSQYDTKGFIKNLINLPYKKDSISSALASLSKSTVLQNFAKENILKLFF